MGVNPEVSKWPISSRDKERLDTAGILKGISCFVSSVPQDQMFTAKGREPLLSFQKRNTKSQDYSLVLFLANPFINHLAAK